MPVSNCASYIPHYERLGTLVVALLLSRGSGGFPESQTRHHDGERRRDAEERMTAPPNDTTTHLQAVIATLRAERDAALSEKDALAEALATRNSEYGERIGQQSATIDVLKVISASLGDP